MHSFPLLQQEIFKIINLENETDSEKINKIKNYLQLNFVTVGGFS
jgi:hypothetical protein